MLFSVLRLLAVQLGVAFAAVELDQRGDGAEIQEALAAMTGQRTVPNVFIKGTHVGGNDDMHKAHSNGRLARLLSGSA